jgi:hypothetical protein
MVQQADRELWPEPSSHHTANMWERVRRQRNLDTEQTVTSGVPYTDNKDCFTAYDSLFSLFPDRLYA